MSQTIAYLRTSTDKQDLNNQKLAVVCWLWEIAQRHSLVT